MASIQNTSDPCKLLGQQVDIHATLKVAGIGVWGYDPLTKLVSWDERCREFFGLSHQNILPYEQAISYIHPEDIGRVNAAVEWALNPESGGSYDVIYRTLGANDGIMRWVRFWGQAYFNEARQVYRFSGLAQDVTESALARLQMEESESRYRALSAQLEQQVQLRTEELATTNEELTTMNEELIDLNDRLIRSNENLEKFAYVASHDLQEPLRKIQSFGDILKTQYTSEFGGEEGIDYLTRMQVAANRMSTLLRDLLSFSRISTQPNTLADVPLNSIITMVLTDLELIVAETGAEIKIEPLPTVTGDPTQLGQLFQNLLSNALKFHRPNIAPVIDVRVQTIAVGKLPGSIQPVRASKFYHRIDVVDNGIGFDEVYLDRIFQVFQRLHGKNQFAGTGIGLAICEKVVTNHGGAITATSKPGYGATFTVYLPL